MLKNVKIVKNGEIKRIPAVEADELFQKKLATPVPNSVYKAVSAGIPESEAWRTPWLMLKKKIRQLTAPKQAEQEEKAEQSEKAKTEKKAKKTAAAQAQV